MLNYLLGFYFLIAFFDKPKPENICGIMYPWHWEQDWGNGAIKINDTCIIKLYADTLIAPVGLLKGIHTYTELFDTVGNELKFDSPVLPYGGFICIGYACNFITIENNPGSDFYKGFWQRTPRGLFIRKKDVADLSLKFQYYDELIFSYGFEYKHQSPRIGVNIPNTCLNIRTGPSTKYPSIGCVHSNELNPIGESRIELLEQKGLWARVHVVNLYYVGEDLSEDPEAEDWEPCPNTVKSELTGWIKIVNEKGFPKIWFTMGGY